VTTEEAPLGLVADDANVYWVASRIEGASSVSEVRRASLDGGSVETLRTTTRQPAALALVKGTVYWVEVAEGASRAELRAQDAAGGQRTVATFDPTFGEVDPFGLAVDATTAYVVFQRFGGAGFDYDVRAVPLGGGPSTVVATDTRPFGSDVRALALEGTELFWGFTAGDLLRANASDRDATAKVVLSVPATGLDAFAVSADALITVRGGVLYRKPRRDGEEVELASNTDAYRTVVPLSGAAVAWGAKSASGTETIRVRRRDGSVCLVATTDVKSVFSIAASKDKIFFANTATKAAGGAVRWARLPEGT